MDARNQESSWRSPQVALAIFYLLIVAGAVVVSSLIENGHGLFGLSEVWGVAIVAGLAVALLILATQAVFNAMRPAPKSINLRQKSKVSPDEWFAVLEEAEHEIYIAGHSMGYWCSKSNRARFRSNLQRVLAGGGEVTLAMLDLGSPLIGPLREATDRDYSRRIEESRPVLEELRHSLSKEERDRLRIKMISDHVGLPYTVVGNERRLLTATYLARSDSDSMPCIDLERDSEEGRAIYDDFHKLADTQRAPGHGAAGDSGLLSRLRRERSG